jgi:hypothetical protein
MKTLSKKNPSFFSSKKMRMAEYIPKENME